MCIEKKSKWDYIQAEHQHLGFKIHKSGVHLWKWSWWTKWV